MLSIEEVHLKFVNDLYQASKLFPYNIYSIIPSLLFLISIFALLHIQINRYTNSHFRWRTKLCKNIIFHWMYFYSTRIWFIFLKSCKWLMKYSDSAIDKTSLRPEEVYYNKLITHICVSILVLGVSVIPCLILYICYLNRSDIPNFLMWVNEDPYVRSEMGTSGHYLERALRPEIYHQPKGEAAYRSGRSSSVDTNVYLRSRSSNSLRPRPVKSAVSMMSKENVVD